MEYWSAGVMKNWNYTKNSELYPLKPIFQNSSTPILLKQKTGIAYFSDPAQRTGFSTME